MLAIARGLEGINLTPDTIALAMLVGIAIVIYKLLRPVLS